MNPHLVCHVDKYSPVRRGRREEDGGGGGGGGNDHRKGTFSRGDERAGTVRGGREGGGGGLRSYSFLGPDLSLSLSLEGAGRVVFLFDGSSEKRIL